MVAGVVVVVVVVVVVDVVVVDVPVLAQYWLSWALALLSTACNFVASTSSQF